MESQPPDGQTVSKWLKRWGFPRRHIDSIDSMTGPGLDAAKSRSERILSGDSLMILCGDRGPGKTQIATFWGREAALQNKIARYYKAHDFLCLIRQQFDDDRQLKGAARDALSVSKKCTLLIIDEWSELAGTEWEKRTMTNIIDHRYDNMLSTVIITNHAPKQAVEAVGASIWSRAEETGGIVLCDWPSYRKGRPE